ncbi:MAG: Sulfate permease 2 [Alyxoria varia]|nr:MAG: Sulfate permease 2 [Alyxoria varia]
MSSDASSKIGHALAKFFCIKLDYRDETGTGDEKLSRGESVFSVSSADEYFEEEPTAGQWLASLAPSGGDVLHYLYSLAPFTHWLHRYNVQWLIGDLVAGITVGAVVVPQSMAYAQLAELDVEFGLYSAFMGTIIYWFFATSKDITIGPVAVMSTVVGNVVLKAQDDIPDVPGHLVASALAVICGAIVFFMGLVRIGWIVEFISLTAVSAFITGSAFYIAMGQVPALLGISKDYVDSRAETYKVVITTLQNLEHCKLDAAIGLTGLLMLYIIKYGIAYAAKKIPSRARLLFFVNTLRTVFVILLYTLISWLVNRTRREESNRAFKTLGDVPRGFQYAARPTIDTRILKSFAGQLPASVIVLLIEHISIAKSFGRINNYTINPSQELLAIGVTNLLGPFLGAYPATGSFSRTAIKSKAGVRTPLAGIITGIVVLLAIYALPAVFFYIPNATLSAVIIHAVLDLMLPANTLYQFWRISPLEVLIFIAGVLVTVFSSIENGIYTTVAISAAMLLFRVVKARGRFIGNVKVHSVVGDQLVNGQVKRNDDDPKGQYEVSKDTFEDPKGDSSTRNVFLPIDHRDGSNPNIHVDHPYPGIFMYRFSEGFNYPNANHYLDHMVEVIYRDTRRTDPHNFKKPGDRPWNDPGPKKGEAEKVDWTKPPLKAVILDFSSVNNVDLTSTQLMIDVRNQLDRYATPVPVEWHIACINNVWTKRALVSAGFGYPNPPNAEGEFKRWKPIFSVADMGGDNSAAAAAERRFNEQERRRKSGEDIESQHRQRGLSHTQVTTTRKVAVVAGLNRPLFHVDLTSALESAIANSEQKEAAAELVAKADSSDSNDGDSKPVVVEDSSKLR